MADIKPPAEKGKFRFVGGVPSRHFHEPMLNCVVSLEGEDGLNGPKGAKIYAGLQKVFNLTYGKEGSARLAQLVEPA